MENFGETAVVGSLICGRDWFELVGVEWLSFLLVEVGLQLFLHGFLLAIVDVQHIFKQTHDLFLQSVKVAGNVSQLLVRENLV